MDNNFLTALSGYGYDMCRYMSCPFGQLCMNGMCMSTGAAGFPESNSLNSFSLYNSSPFSAIIPDRSLLTATYTTTKYCTINGDCYPGQMCMYGRCIPSVNSASLGGIQPCNSMQHCFNGQICVNGYCTQSNVAYSGSQAQFLATSCSAGAVCPIGQYCINGICRQNSLMSTFACANGSCPPGMACRFGRCINVGYVGKR